MIGFIGLGAMGAKMCANLIKKGYQVTVYDVVPAAVDGMKALGASAAASPAAMAAEADVVFTSLPNSAIVEDTMLGANGILAGAKPGLFVIDLSSITPRVIQKLAKIAAEKGVDLIDAPVSGGTAGAEKGTLTIMVGASEALFAKAKPYLECIGTKIDHIGDVGAGDTVKLVNNLLFGCNMAALAEAMVLGVKAGLAPHTLFDIISKSSGSSYALTAKYENFFSKGNFQPGFMVDLEYKDLQLAIDTAKDVGMPLLFGNMAQQVYEAARAKGYGKEDMSAIIKLAEEFAGVEVREK
ncbi:MAG: NAD(P)-dependent oxidoreductase [Planctomycetaceae bacterium]|nr:NAD(P)-dependent oxidoreductase [Planctomycetaceae bacterium]